MAFKGSERLVGQPAKNQAAKNHTNTVYDAKRLIGRKIDDKAVVDDMKHWPFKVVGDKDGKPLIEVEVDGKRKKYHPEEISAMVVCLALS
eukprot:SAG31_NODE_1446_length_8318_cov_8.573914_4_plen_90_part_00